MIIQKANTINSLMRILLDHVAAAPDGISSRGLKIRTRMNNRQFSILTEVLVRTGRIVNENGMWRIAKP
jgi:hypothetical protein